MCKACLSRLTLPEHFNPINRCTCLSNTIYSQMYTPSEIISRLAVVVIMYSLDWIANKCLVLQSRKQHSPALLNT